MFLKQVRGFIKNPAVSLQPLIPNPGARMPRKGRERRVLVPHWKNIFLLFEEIKILYLQS